MTGSPLPGCYCESCNALRVNLRWLELKPHRSVYDKARYAALKARGKCVVCGKHFAQRGLRCCVCAEANHAAVERWKKKFSKREPTMPNLT